MVASGVGSRRAIPGHRKREPAVGGVGWLAIRPELGPDRGYVVYRVRFKKISIIDEARYGQCLPGLRNLFERVTTVL